MCLPPRIVECLHKARLHFGLTGEDLVARAIADADRRVVFIDELGFGHANVVVAVPQAWIDVRCMAILTMPRTAFHVKHQRRCGWRPNTVNLTRNFFSRCGVTEYASWKARARPKARRLPGLPSDRGHHHDREQRSPPMRSRCWMTA